VIYFYYGEDEFEINRAVKSLRISIESINYTHIKQQKNADLDWGLEVAATSSLNGGCRLVWVENCVLKPETLESLMHIPSCNQLVLSSPKPLDMRLKVGKYLQKVAEVRAFSLISPWRDDLLRTWVSKAVNTLGLEMEPPAVQALVNAVGNQSRQLHHELEKLSLYSQGNPITVEMVTSLCTSTAQTSLDLCQSLLHQHTDQSVQLIQGLLAANEHSLKILKTIGSQFRMWLHVQSLIEDGESDERIAQKAGIGNPGRLFYIRKELKGISTARLEKSLGQILETEYQLKLGGNDEGCLRDLAFAMS